MRSRPRYSGPSCRLSSLRVIGIMSGLACPGCFGHDPVCEYDQTRVVESFSDLESAPTHPELDRSVAEIYADLRSLSGGTVRYFHTASSDEMVTATVAQSGNAELHEFSDADCRGDLRWVQAPTELRLAPASNAWSLVATGALSFDPVYPPEGTRFRVDEIVVQGPLADVLDPGDPRGPENWSLSVAYGFEGDVYLNPRLVYGDPDRPGSREIFAVELERSP